MEIEIREIRETDYPAVMSLWNNELGYHWISAENIALHYDRVKNDENYKTFVVLLENKVIGFISTVKAFFPGLEAGYMYIQGFAVQEEVQNRGIGTKLLEHTENYARRTGLYSVILNSRFERAAAHAFYEHNGYEKSSYCFNKVL